MMTSRLGSVLGAGLVLAGAVAHAQGGFDEGNSGGRLGRDSKPIEPPAMFNPQIDQLYRQAVQLFRSRRYDEAEALCQRILAVKTNELNTVNLLREISEMRTRVPAYDPGAAMKRRLQETRIPNFKAVGVEVRDLIEPLQKASATGTADRVPLNLLWHYPAGEKIPQVTFDLHNVTLAEVLYYVTFRNGLTYRVDENAVVIGKNLSPTPAEDGGMSPLKRKLRETILPEIKVTEAKVQDAVGLVQSKSEFNAVWQVPSELTQTPVTVHLHRVSVADALRYITELAGLRYQLDERAVILYPADSPATSATATKQP